VTCGRLRRFGRGPAHTAARVGLGLALGLALGCAPIDVHSEVTVHPRDAPVRSFGVEQLSGRDYVVDYVQLGPRLLVSVREQRSCVSVTHIPVLRKEQIDRSNRHFVVWDFALGTLFGGFAGLAFARPQLFSDRLTDGTGRVVYANTSGYVVGGVFAAISAGLLAAGVVDGLRSRDETRYADAFEVELGPSSTCAGEDPSGRALIERRLVLRIGEDHELEATTDGEGRARFSLPAELAAAPTDTGTVAAMLAIADARGEAFEAKQPLLRLRVPFEGLLDAHTGVADTRALRAPPAGIELDRSRVRADPDDEDQHEDQHDSGERDQRWLPEADPDADPSEDR
jgi:hypothetical protein